MRKVLITLTAGLAIAAAALPAAAGAGTEPVDGSRPNDTALRPTAIEYGLIYASTAAGPGAASAVDPGVLDLGDDPNADPAADAPTIARAGISALGAD